jgi:hypothetical protein
MRKRSVAKGDPSAVDLELDLDHVVKYVCKESSLRILYKGKPAILIWSRKFSVPWSFGIWKHKIRRWLAEAKATPKAKAKVEDMVASKAKAKAKVAAASKVEDVDDLVSEEAGRSTPIN